MGCINRRPETSFSFVAAQSVNNLFISDLSSPIDFCSQADVPLATPTVFAFDTPTETTLDYSYTSNSGGDEAGFEVQLSLLSDFSVVLQTDNNGSGVVTGQFTGLDGGTMYYGRVRATGAIPSDWSNTDSEFTVFDFNLGLDTDASVEYGSFDASLDSVAYPDEMALAFWFKSSAFTAANKNAFVADFRKLGGGFLIPNIRNENGVASNFRIIFAKNGGSTVTVKSGDGATSFYDGAKHRVLWRIIESPDDSSCYRFSLHIDDTVLDLSTGSEPEGWVEHLKSDFPTTFGDDYNELFTSNFTNPNMVIDEFIFVDGALSDADITNDYNAGNGSNWLKDNYPSVFHHDFDTAGAVGGANNAGLTTLTDQSGNGHDVTLSGFTLNGATSNYVDF